MTPQKPIKPPRHVFFGNEKRLEGIYTDSGTDRCAVISHPHPLMGGTMQNNVVRTVSDSLLTCGISTLRFNFRGVGRSTGRYDSGTGEQDDLLAAVSFLADAQCRNTLLAGYSFGAWISAMAITKMRGGSAILIAPPVELFPFPTDTTKGMISLIVGAEHDAYSSVRSMENLARALDCQLVIVPEADHFFTDQEAALADVIVTFCNQM